jgi:hypothetical protein
MATEYGYAIGKWLPPSGGEREKEGGRTEEGRDMSMVPESANVPELSLEGADAWCMLHAMLQ